MDKNYFINLVGKLIQDENKKRGNPLFASVVISQACLETGYGSSQIMTKANAIFGIKASKNWGGKVYSAKTKECYDGKNFSEINDYFRAYNSLEEGIADYFDLITKLERYRKACIANSPLECITEIYNGGYATDPNYISKIMWIINNFHLTDFDEEIDESGGENYFKVGEVYEIQVKSGLNVRENAGTNSRILKYEELTEDGQKHAYKRINAVLKKGTKVTCKEVVFIGNETWIRIPSGFIAGFYNGEFYVK